ncbi:MAG: cobalt transporter [Alphaproteobacteria bacterium]|nr:MAG: cobalt transporter [Alphaproteobacteria bacterium]
MHIEPGVVDGAKMILSYGTGAGAFGIIGGLAYKSLKEGGNITSLALRSLATTSLVFSFFEVLPHVPVGVSEVHLILGSTLLLLFGAAPAAVGLAAGLLIQGLFFAPFDLPQYGINVTTLIVPLLGIHMLAKHLIAPDTPYVDLTYRQALALSTSYQGGIVSWVAFWALYGQGFSIENLTAISTFGASYMLVVTVEPLIDLGVLAVAKTATKVSRSRLFTARLMSAA